MSKKMQSAVSSIEAARMWEAKNQPAWVVRCLSSALMNYLSVAICEMVQVQEAQAWLRQNEVDKILGKYAENVKQVASSVELGKLPASVLGGAYSHLVFAHLSCLLDAPDTGRLFALIASSGDVAEISSPFWGGYARCYQSLISGGKETAIVGAVRGQEKYWATYVALMNTAMVGEGLEKAIHEVDKSFAERNRDSSISDDSYEIEGTAQQPAQWDFRKEAILIAVRSMSRM